MKLHFSVASAALFALVCGGGTALAAGKGTRDESPPAEETVCDDAGLVGAAYGLCVAYCEANDCELDPDAQECHRLRANFEKITGSTSLPCEAEEK